MRDYQKELLELQNGMKEEMKVSSEEFLQFREVWTKMPNHHRFVGFAEDKGNIFYHYFDENDMK